MKYSLILLIWIVSSGFHEAKVIQTVPSEVSNQNIISDGEEDPTYGETVDWILEKLKLYAKGYDMEYYKNSEFEEYYPKVRMDYGDLNIKYGKFIITENYRYSGANISKENNYNGYISRVNIQEIPINNIVEIKLFESKSFCNLQIQTKDRVVKFTRNLQAIEGYDPNIPSPIVEYSDRGGVYFRCVTENDLENRLKKAFAHLKKLNLERYPEKKEKF